MPIFLLFSITFLPSLNVSKSSILANLLDLLLSAKKSPDWEIVKKIYLTNPDTYSVFTPFAYSYLEEMIRTTTSEYGLPLFHNNKPINIKVGMKLIALAKKENIDNKEYIRLLDEIKIHFDKNHIYDGNGRNKVIHGHLHPRFWYKEDFEKLIHDIALLSPFSKF